MEFSRRSFIEFIRNTTFFSLFFFGFTKYWPVKAAELQLRPPGAVDEEAFIAGCIRCGICVDVCRNHQTNVLKTMTLADGFYSAGLPRFAASESYCERCLECNIVCPTNVLKPVSSEKLGIGTSTVDLEKCLLAFGRYCDRCFHICELDAIVPLEKFELENAKGFKNMKVSYPSINEDICDGCSACAHLCSAFKIKPDASKRQPRS